MIKNLKKLLILSGKGGTGKTTVAAAFIKLLQAKGYADCDVDAPNLHLALSLEETSKNKDYFGLQKAHIDKDVCIGCGICKEKCRFGAISNEGLEYEVDNYSCEGCSVCEFVCPVKAISMNDWVSGEMMLYSKDRIFSTACLKMGSGNSGKLVAAVKKDLYKNILPDTDYVIIDGSPGIGCPVIASLSGVDMVLIVAEPSVSGLSDMKRIIDTARNFGVKIAVCINKYDTNNKISKTIEEYCEKEKLSFVGNIPYDRQAVYATNQGLSIVDIDCPSGGAVKEILEKVIIEL